MQRIRQLRTSSTGLPQLLTGDDPTGAFDDLVKLIKDAGFSFDLVPPGSRYLRSANGVTVGGQVRAVTNFPAGAVYRLAAIALSKLDQPGDELTPDSIYGPLCHERAQPQ